VEEEEEEEEKEKRKNRPVPINNLFSGNCCRVEQRERAYFSSKESRLQSVPKCCAGSTPIATTTKFAAHPPRTNATEDALDETDAAAAATENALDATNNTTVDALEDALDATDEVTFRIKMQPRRQPRTQLGMQPRMQPWKQLEMRPRVPRYFMKNIFCDGDTLRYVPASKVTFFPQF